MTDRAPWTVDEAWAWYQDQPWLVGCNFIPSTAVNQLEMWQAETFDLTTIERELSWASDIGFNTARVFLHNLLWQHDSHGFIERIEQFLEAGSKHGIRPLFVLFDGVWFPRPRLGAQPAPTPHVHNSRWVQSPGAEVLADPSRHDALEPYVSGVIGHFAADERVLGWDLFNEPDNPNANHPLEIEDKPERAIQLLRKAYQWARDTGPSQPITSGVWRGRWSGEGVAPINRLMLSESDVASFHSYDPVERLLARIEELQTYNRPLLLTEYLSRGSGSTFEAVVPIAKERGIGAYNWGLVSGKTQTIYPWDSWTKAYAGEPEPWFHDVLRPDGTPYRQDEIDLIGRLARP
jgi:hypothetical protein